MKIIGEIKLKSDVILEICDGTLIPARVQQITNNAIKVVTVMGIITVSKE